jgi:hypothetical protein
LNVVPRLSKWAEVPTVAQETREELAGGLMGNISSLLRESYKKR